MKVIVMATVENAEEYQGKTGYGCNITVSTLLDKKRESLEFNSKNPLIFAKCNEFLQEDVVLELDLQQSKFGLRIADVMSVNRVEA